MAHRAPTQAELEAAHWLVVLEDSRPSRADIEAFQAWLAASQHISCPLILFQGLEDKVVPFNQAERMFNAVKFKEIPVAYLAFAGEQHGFRRAENIKRVLDAELYFYSKVFKFDLADAVEPVEIENL
jgi:dienelactone hydrolase